MDRRLTLSSTFNEIARSLADTMKEIDAKGKTKELQYDLLIKTGRLDFMEGKFEEAYQGFQECIAHFAAGQKDNELYYWISRCLEGLGEKDKALSGYLMALEKNEDDDELTLMTYGQFLQNSAIARQSINKKENGRVHFKLSR